MLSLFQVIGSNILILVNSLSLSFIVNIYSNYNVPSPTHWLTQEESIWKKVWSMKRSKASFFQARRVYWYPLRLLNSWMQAR